NERVFARHTSANPVARVAGWWMGRTAKKKAEEKHNRAVAQVRLLTIELALRCYRSQQGRSPERLEQLVPTQLPRVPVDPFSSRPLIYRPQGTNWQLYSIGPDHVDDGGIP